MRGLRIIFLQIVLGCLWLLTLVSGITFLGIPGRVGRLVGSEMRTDTVKNVQQCKILCEHQSRCKSFNYNVKTGECTSNYQDLLTANPASIDAHPELVFAEKRFMSQSGGVCSSSPCSETQVCTPLGSTEVCLTEEIICGNPANIGNAEFSTTGKTYKSVATYSCVYGYNRSGGTSVSYCTIKGTWSPVNLICKVDCGILDIKNGSLMTNSTLFGSRGTVRCDELFQFFGNSNTADCQSSGSWAGINGSCLQVEWINQSVPSYLKYLLAMIPAPITDGWEMVLNSVLMENDTQVRVDIGNRTEFVLITALLTERIVIVNSLMNGQWMEGSGHYVKTDTFPFETNVPFELKVAFQSSTYMFSVDGISIYNYTVQYDANEAEKVYIRFVSYVQKLRFKY